MLDGKSYPLNIYSKSIFKEWDTMKILVTGGWGFIGSSLVDKLIFLVHKVSVIDNLSTGTIENINPNSRFYKVDILDDEVLDIS